MTDLTRAKTVAFNSSDVAGRGITMAMANAKLRESYETLASEVEALSSEVASGTERLTVMQRASSILATVSENSTNQVLKAITDVINKALAVLFPADPKTVGITHSLYRDTHPHYTLTLKTSDGIVRTFNQSGTGLAQIISFLFTVCLIDARNQRKIMVMDELLNGLHPEAKKLVRHLMTALTTREHDPFQFICIEYGMDIGRQYEIVKGERPDNLAIARETSGYYAHVGVAEEDVE